MGKKIFLLADDDSDDTAMFSEALMSIDNSIVCYCVANGREALQKLDELNEVNEKPHLIFLDVNMPVMNGWQCLKIIIEDGRYRSIPVIIISTSSYQREMDIAADLGAFCYFTKPNDFNDLTQVLQVIAANLGDELGNALRNLQASGSQFVHAFTGSNQPK